MSTELAVHRGARPMISKQVLDEQADQRKLLMQYVESQMVLDTDYGVIPGTKNRTLLKPGAEKLTDLFLCVPKFTILDKVENWDTGLFHYQYKCEIIVRDSDMVVAEGFGSCSTYESKYRFRNKERCCPNCGKASIIKGKAEYGGGWLCWAKKDGCGSKFGDEDPMITEQVVEKITNPDIHDCVNTVLKMAKKRAHVDAAISLARCSDMFTQDAEDLPTQDNVPAKAADAKKTESAKDKKSAKPVTKLDEVRKWWETTKFADGTEPDDTAQHRFDLRTYELFCALPKFATIPVDPPAHDVREWVRHGLQLGEEQELSTITVKQLREGEKMVVNYLKLCKPLESKAA